MKSIYILPPVEKFIFTLEKQTIAKVLHTIDLLEIFEYKLGIPHSKHIQNDVYELRIRGKQEVRLFYTVKNSISIVHGFIKKTQKIPKKEIHIAILRIQTLVDV